MINMRTRLLFTLLVIVAFICMPSFLQAQRGPGGDPDATTGIPFDGGLTLILAAGAGYAIKKARDKRNRAKDVIEK
jgi:hypothetical protein